MFFRSEYGAKVINGPNEFEVKEFHLHSKSEHTIEGVHFDAEMHIVHMPAAGATTEQKGNALAAAMGIIFDTRADVADKVNPEVVTAIDAFFDSLSLNTDTTSTNLPEVKLANLMKYADLNNRWSYKGSLTTPPCSKTVFFNVLRTVWPMKKKHLDMLHNLMKNHGKGAFFSKADGNHRVVQPVNTQDPVIITNNYINEAAAGGEFRGLFIAFLVLFILSLVAVLVACCLYMRAATSARVMVPQESMDVEIPKVSAE
jgi:carbonic anhydrase